MGVCCAKARNFEAARVCSGRLHVPWLSERAVSGADALRHGCAGSPTVVVLCFAPWLLAYYSVRMVLLTDWRTHGRCCQCGSSSRRCRSQRSMSSMHAAAIWSRRPTFGPLRNGRGESMRMRMLKPQSIECSVWGEILVGRNAGRPGAAPSPMTCRAPLLPPARADPSSAPSYTSFPPPRQTRPRSVGIRGGRFQPPAQESRPLPPPAHLRPDALDAAHLDGGECWVVCAQMGDGSGRGQICSVGGQMEHA